MTGEPATGRGEFDVQIWDRRWLLLACAGSCFVGIGVLAGSLAALLDAVWIDVVFAGYVVAIALAIPFAVRFARSRQREP